MAYFGPVGAPGLTALQLQVYKSHLLSGLQHIPGTSFGLFRARGPEKQFLKCSLRVLGNFLCQGIGASETGRNATRSLRQAPHALLDQTSKCVRKPVGGFYQCPIRTCIIPKRRHDYAHRTNNVRQNFKQPWLM